MDRVTEALEEKLKIYESRKAALNPDLKKWIGDSNLWMGVYTALRLNGIAIGKKQLVDMLDGQVVNELPLDLHRLIHNFDELYRDMKSSVVMQSDPDIKLGSRWAEMLFEGVEFRTNNPIIYEWGYITPNFREVQELLTKLFRMRPVGEGLSYYRQCFGNFIEFLKVYPYGEFTMYMGMAYFMYLLMEKSIPVPNFGVSDTEFNQMMTDYLDGKGEEVLSDMADRSLLNRMDSIVNLCLAAEEKND